jgi:MuDR family transposase
MGNWKVVELFVDPESKLGTSNSQPRLTQAFASSSRIVKCEVHRDTPHEEHQRPSYSPNPTTHRHLSLDCNNDADVDADAFEFDNTLDGISPFERVEHMISSDNTLIGNTCSDEQFNFMDFNDIEETNEDIDEEFNMNNNDNYPRWLFKDRSDSHPVASFNAIEGIIEFAYDDNYFNDMNYTTDDNLVVDQVFRTKDHLKWVVHDFHIRANRTFHAKKTNKQVYTVICTHQNYKWRLYAIRRSYDDAFVIKT